MGRTAGLLVTGGLLALFNATPLAAAGGDRSLLLAGTSTAPLLSATANQRTVTQKVCVFKGNNGIWGSNNANNNAAQLTTDLQTLLDDDTCTVLTLPMGLKLKLSQPLTIGFNTVRTNNLDIVCVPDVLPGGGSYGSSSSSSAVSITDVVPSGLSTDFPFKNCILDGNGQGPVLTVVSVDKNSKPANSNLIYKFVGITFTNGKTTAVFDTTQPSGFANTAANPTVGPGGGLRLVGVNTKAYIKNCRFENNIAVSPVVTPVLGSVLGTGNAVPLANGWGGGIFVGAQMISVDISLTTFVSNSADNGGGVAAWAFQGLHAPLVSIESSYFQDNSASVSGGGFLYYTEDVPGQPGLFGNVLTSPTMPNPYGSATIDNTVFDSNTAAGGAFTVVTPSGNGDPTAGPCFSSGGTIFCPNAGGGAIALYNVALYAHVIVFKGNQASVGAMVFEFAATVFDCDGCKFLRGNNDIGYAKSAATGTGLCAGSLAGTIVLADQTPSAVAFVGNGNPVIPAPVSPVVNLNLQLFPPCNGQTVASYLGAGVVFDPPRFLVVPTFLFATFSGIITCSSPAASQSDDGQSTCCSQKPHDCTLFLFKPPVPTAGR